MQKDLINHITHLFFVRSSSKAFLKINQEVLIMDCTYKINRYQMFLLIISGQTALHINFFVAFSFMAEEQSSDYCWVLQQLRALYLELELLDPTVIITDMKRGLMKTCDTVFEDINHLLCFWHINKNVIAKCRNSFDNVEAWETFYLEWKLMVYASSEKEF